MYETLAIGCCGKLSSLSSVDIYNDHDRAATAHPSFLTRPVARGHD
jgi:hypothetical protein